MQRAEFSRAVQLYAERQRRTGNIDWAARRAWWEDKISALISDIETWLAPLSDAHLVVVTRDSCSLSEENIGNYKANALNIRLGDNSLSITPVGTLVIGGFGRFDVEGPRGKALLILVNEKQLSGDTQAKDNAEWFIAHPKDRQNSLRPLNEEAFQELFLDLFGISN